MSMPRRKTASQINTHKHCVHLYHMIHSHSKFHTKGNTTLSRLLRLEARCGCTQHINRCLRTNVAWYRGPCWRDRQPQWKNNTHLQTHCIKLLWHSTEHPVLYGNTMHKYANALRYLSFLLLGLWRLFTSD